MPLCLVGVRTRGVPLAQRPVRSCAGWSGQDIDVGAVDITLYRDDLGRTERWPVLRGTDISFSVDGAEVCWWMTSSSRAERWRGLERHCDLGRPACIRLAVLVDRGHREIPVQPDVVGLHVTTEYDEHVCVRLEPIDRVDEVVRIAEVSAAQS